MQNSPAHPDRRITLDLCLIAIIVFLNPVMMCFNCDLMYYSPDSVMYAYMAEQFTLFRPALAILGISHIDAGLFYPPLFPAMMALFSPLVDDLYQTAPLVSRLNALILLIPAYLLLKNLANRPVALFTCLLLPLGSRFFIAAMSPLSETSFMFCSVMLAAACWYWLEAYDRMTCRMSLITGFSLALIAGLCFFARQIGAFAFPFLIMFLLAIAFYKHDGNSRRNALLSLFAAIAGITLIVGCYTTFAWLQTGQLPFKQHFRSGNYVIKTAEPDILQRIEELKSAQRGSEFSSIHRYRRALRELTPDSSEMLAYVKKEQSGNPGSTVSTTERRLKKLLPNLLTNTAYIDRMLGRFNFVLCLAALLTPLIFRHGRAGTLARLIVPLMIISFMLTLSLITSFYERYVMVLLPLLLIQVASELYQLYFQARNRFIWLGKPRYAIGMLLLASSAHTASHPRLFSDIDIYPKTVIWHELFDQAKPRINGDPVFTIDAHTAWIANGRYRKLPNDKLEKVARYAELTGVRWLIVDQHGQGEKKHYYSNIGDWFEPGRIDQEYPELIRYCCSALTDDGKGYLVFEFIHDKSLKLENTSRK